MLLLAYCRECGTPQGFYKNSNDLRIKIAEQRVCVKCETSFNFLTDGRIWNLNIEKIDAKNSIDVQFNSVWDIIHTKVCDVSKKRFTNGEFADSVEASFKEINMIVKRLYRNKTGVEKDGQDLMFSAFKPEKPIIVLDDLTTETGQSIQRGYMYLFAGAMSGIRNPKAHENIVISPERALHHLVLASLLVEKLDESGQL